MRNTGQSGQREAGRGTTRAPEFLIANLELEFHITPIRISNLKFSNRKFSAIFSLKLVADGERRAAFSSPQTLVSSLQKPWLPWRLIVTPRLEFFATRTKQTPNQDSNRYRSRFSRPGCISEIPSLPAHCFRGPELVGTFTNHVSPVTSHFSSAPCIAPPPRLTWRLATLPPRSSADAIQSQSFAIYPDVARIHRFCRAASGCEPASDRRSCDATARRRYKSSEKLEARAC
jgi:hypothetical protein